MNCSATKRRVHRRHHGQTGPHRRTEGGSLFLDEVGEMPGPMQVSLLRFLDRNEFPCRQYANAPGDVASSAPPIGTFRNSSFQGRFRDDLLYRINTG